MSLYKSLLKDSDTTLTQFVKEGKITQDDADEIRDSIEERDKKGEQFISLVESTDIPPKTLWSLLKDGFSGGDVARMDEIADKYGIQKGSIRSHVLNFIKRGVTERGDIVDLMEAREVLRIKEDFRSYAPDYASIIGAHNAFGGKEGGIEALRGFTNFILDNEWLILSALGYEPQVYEMRKIEFAFTRPIYQLNEKDPERTKKALEQLVVE